MSEEMKNLNEEQTEEIKAPVEEKTEAPKLPFNLSKKNLAIICGAVAAVIVLVLVLVLTLGGGKDPHTHSYEEGKCACGETDPNYVPAGPAFDAAATVAGFASKVEGTVKLTYVTNYKVDVVRPGADASGMASFMRDVVATTVVEMDLSDLYIKVTKTRQDKLVDDAASATSTAFAELVW